MIPAMNSMNPNDAMARAFLKKSIRRGKESGFSNAESFRVLFHRKSGNKSVLSSVSGKKKH